MHTRPNEIYDFTQLITLLLGEDEYNTLEHNVSSSEQAQLLSLYNGLHNKNYQDLKKYIPKSKFTDKIYKKICLAAVKKKGRALQFVREEERSYELCLAAVQKDGLALEFVPEKNHSEEIFSSAMQKDGWALQFIPKKKRSHDLCLEAVKNNVWALRFVPENEHIEKIYLSAVQESILALQLIPEENLSDKLCLEAVKNNGLTLEFVPDNKKSKKICLEAVRENSLALEFVPEDMKLSIIKNIEPELILSNNYFSIYYFHSTYNMENTFNDFLKKIEHVIVTKEYMDEEEKNSFLVYGNKRLGKTTHIANKSVHELLDDLMKIDNKKDINLVLIGHANEKSDKIADLNIKNIISLLEKYNIINRVTLLGCHSAKSSQLNSEKKRLNKLSISDKKRFGKKYGLVLATESCFKETPVKKLLGGADVVYVIKSLGSGKYDLAYVKKESMKKRNIKSLNEEDVITLQNLSKGKIKKGFAEFLGKKPQCSLRTKENPLNPDELDVISSIIKSPKEVYPSLKSATIGRKETKKLKESLLEKLVTAIEENNEITQKIIVKGYTQAVHADPEKMGFRVAGTRLYTDTSGGLFSIDPQKFSADQRKTMRTIRSFNESEDTEDSEDTISKSVRVIIPPKRRR